MLIKPNFSKNLRFATFDFFDMFILILPFFTSINGKNNGEIRERHRTAPVQDCEKSFQTYNTEYNSTVLLDQSADGRYGRFR